MADDLRDTLGDDAFLDTEEELIEEGGGEATNRTFLIGVALLGSLLLFAIAAFVVWALVLNPRQVTRQAEENARIVATNEAVLIAMQQTQTVEAMPTSTPMATATAIKEPTSTPTPVIRATNTPTPEGGTGGNDAGQSGESAAVTPGVGTLAVGSTATVSARATATPRAVGTTTASNSPSATPDTGLGEVLLIVAAGLLATIVIFARKLRRA